MSSASPPAATLDDLYHVEGKAELIGGRIVRIMPTGRRPNLVAGRIYRTLADHVDAVGQGEAYADNMGFTVPELPSGRQSFSPDVAYDFGPFPPDDMKFIAGPPTFAVEVRSEGDYGPAAEVAIEAKRADYFEAGTLAVWDVDPIAEKVDLYLATDPENGRTFASGDTADAGPAVPGWRMAIDRIFG